MSSSDVEEVEPSQSFTVSKAFDVKDYAKYMSTPVASQNTGQSSSSIAAPSGCSGLQRVELKSSESPSGSDKTQDEKGTKKKKKKDKDDKNRADKDTKRRRKEDKEKDEKKDSKKDKKKVDAEQELVSLFGPNGPEDDDEEGDPPVDSDEQPVRKKPAGKSRDSKAKPSKKDKTDKKTKKSTRKGNKRNDGDFAVESSEENCRDDDDEVADTQIDSPDRPTLRRMTPLDEDLLKSIEMADAAEALAMKRKCQEKMVDASPGYSMGANSDAPLYDSLSPNAQTRYTDGISVIADVYGDVFHKGITGCSGNDLPPDGLPYFPTGYPSDEELSPKSLATKDAVGEIQTIEDTYSPAFKCEVFPDRQLESFEMEKSPACPRKEGEFGTPGAMTVSDGEPEIPVQPESDKSLNLDESGKGTPCDLRALLASQASPMHDRLPGDSVALDSGDHVPMEPKALPKKRGRPPKAESKPKAKPTPKAKCKGKIAKPKACSSKSKAKAAGKPKAAAKPKASSRTSRQSAPSTRALKQDWNNVYSRAYHAAKRAGATKEEAKKKGNDAVAALADESVQPEESS